MPKVARVDIDVMAQQVGPGRNKPEWTPGLRVLVGAEASFSGFHRGQQSQALQRRPNIRLQPYLCCRKESLLQNRRRPYRRPCTAIRDGPDWVRTGATTHPGTGAQPQSSRVPESPP